MQFLPKDLLEKLEFDKLSAIAAGYCYGALGIHRIQTLQFFTDKPTVVQKLDETLEFTQASANNEPIPMRSYKAIGEDLKMLEIEDFVLSEESLGRINQMLIASHQLNHFFTDERKELYPTLFNRIQAIEFEPALIEAIERVIDDQNQIKPDASPALAKIRKKVGNKQRELDKIFKGLIGTYRSNGWLTDNIESFRNGRRVLSVPSEHKRKIRGIIHDESTTGKTAFIEPEQVIDVNNDIFDLVTEEKKEIYRILKELSAILRPFIENLETYQDLIAYFDEIHAKATLAQTMNGIKPKVFGKPKMGIKGAVHPLLYLKNKEQEKVTVPFDLSLNPPNRILVLSGPNAGGKSISMKTVGLIQLMLQSGMLVPVEEDSEMGIFKKIFADIGDQQSIEDDLSTYSSRLANMKAFLDAADKDSLVLIDEFGSGTDPKIGGSIAEAILKKMNDQKVFGFITTHYSNLKIFAFKTRGLVNASMLFNKEELSPTYQLKVGKPGSSYAFEIAQKSGLSKEILNYAKHKTGKNEKAVDQLLIDLQREKQELEDKLEKLSDKQGTLDKLISSYESMHKDLEYRRKRIKLSAKEVELQRAASENQEMEELIRKLKEEKNLEKAKQIAKQKKETRQKLMDALTEMKEEVYQEPQASGKTTPIQAGDFVKIRTGGAAGQVESVEKKHAIVQMGFMRMKLPLQDLVHANEPLNVKTQKSINTEMIMSRARFEAKLDIRGMTIEEGMKSLDIFMDEALISNAVTLQIVHGKGTGALRKAVHKRLNEYAAVERIWHPEREGGGDGVSLVELS